jgi:aspartate aminotransferase
LSTSGARLAAQILNSPELYKDWKVEVKGMADRIISMREALYDLLQNKYNTPGDWSHVKKQIGMFSYTGLKPEQVDALATHAHIYLTRDGRSIPSPA